MVQTTMLCEASSFRRRRAPAGHAVVDGRCRGTLLVALGTLALAWSQAAYAAGIFLPATATDLKSAVDQGVARAALAKPGERRVRVAHEALNVARDDVEIAGEARLLFNVRDRLQLDVVVDRTARTRWGYSLSGRVVGEGVGFVTLVVHEEAVAGSIWTPDSAYELNHLGEGIHALRDVTNASPLECGGALASSGGRNWRQLGPTTRQADGGNSVVDVLVVWTPEAEEKHFGGGEARVRLQIDNMVAYTNDAFERSGAFITLNLVGAERMDGYTETDWFTDLGRLAVPDDGHMDRATDLRDDLGADLVYLLSRIDAGLANWRGAFSMGGRHASTFAHELGHNFGIGHERLDFPELWYYYGFTTEDCQVTIMSYGTECRARFRFSRRSGVNLPPLYASPWRYSPGNGIALGVTRFSKRRGARGAADAVLTLNRNRHRVADFRPSRRGS